MIKVSRASVGPEELAAVGDALGYGYYGLAAKVIEFEAEAACFLGVPAECVVSTNTGTSALHLALDALGVGAGDEVIVPSLTFVGSFQAILATGATPVACDVREDTLCIDPDDVRRRMTERTRAVMPVDYAGQLCDLAAIESICGRSVEVVEDAAHAFGSARPPANADRPRDAICFSFDSIKNITCGEGGLVVCRDPDVVESLRRKRLLGIDRRSHASSSWKERSWQYTVATTGFRYHMSNLNAAIGLAQLPKAAGFIARRRAICRRYDAAFRDLPGVRPLDVDYDVAAPHIYVIRVEGGRRDALMEWLKLRDVETGVNYIPNHLQPLFGREGLRLPVTEQVFPELLTLPLHCELSDVDVDAVIAHVTEFVA